MKLNFTSGFEAWLELNGQYLIGKKEIEILEHIRQQGSFMRAAKTLGLSYAHAWNSIDKIQKILGTPLVEARRGGASGGGGATLTNVANNILSEYRILQKRLLKSADKSILSKQEADLFKKKVWIPDITIIGSNSIGIELIIEQMLSEKKFSYEIVNVGSSGGLNAIMLSEADIAGVHLSDSETGEYNISFMNRYWITGKAIMIRGFKRKQGLIVKKRNPKQIFGFRDLLRKEVKLINRGLGSGTRHLLDEGIQQIAKEDGIEVKTIINMIHGYDHEVNSHPEVAEAVQNGEADVGLGVEVRTVKMNLDFIPIQEEWFDFVLEKTRMQKPVIELFFKTLKSDKLKDTVQTHAPELKYTDKTGKIIYQP